MSDPTCRHYRDLLGVYVVGAIEPHERSQLDSHLTQCYDCREELAGLAVLPALLNRVPLGEAEQIAGSAGPGPYDQEDPVPQVLTGLLADVGSRRRSRRLRTVLAAAAAVIIALGGGAAIATWAGGPAASKFEVVSGKQGNIDVIVRYDQSRWGTAMWVKVRGVPEWSECKFWVRTAGGRSELAGGWLVGPDSGRLWYPTQANVTASSVTAFTLTSAGQTLVTIPAK